MTQARSIAGEPIVRRILLRRRIPLRDLPDLHQEVLIATWLSVEGGGYDETRGALPNYMAGITHHTASHYQHRAHVQHEVLSEHEHVRAIESTVEHDMFVQTLPRFLDKLEPGHSRILRRLIEGHEMNEIAALEGLPVSTTYKRYYRACEVLKVLYHQNRRETESSNLS